MPGFVAGEGPVPCRWFVLGEAPGATEEEAGRPFVGRSGALLRNALRAGGVPPEAVYITNSYKFRPPGNRNPTAQELADHRGFLEQELADVRPARVLTLGNVALQVIVRGAPGITRCHGEWLVSDWDMTDVLPAYHPAYVLRNQNLKEDFFEDVATFLGA